MATDKGAFLPVVGVIRKQLCGYAGGNFLRSFGLDLRADGVG
ncbi:MAG: hypothetical protein ACOYI4_09295 [Christensenellales bacterium]